jgi:hypothetical protein
MLFELVNGDGDLEVSRSERRSLATMVAHGALDFLVCTLSQGHTGELVINAIRGWS